MKLSAKQVDDSRQWPSGVHHDNPYNSTPFTNCCNVAITEHEQQCPLCERYVVGWDSKNRNKDRFYYAFNR